MERIKKDLLFGYRPADLYAVSSFLSRWLSYVHWRLAHGMRPKTYVTVAALLGIAVAIHEKVIQTKKYINNLYLIGAYLLLHFLFFFI